MSTSGNKPPNGPITSEPETEKKGWSEEEKRMFLISLLGGLGANVGTVLIVAVAVVADRFGIAHNNPWWVVLIFILGGGILGLLFNRMVREIAPNTSTRTRFVAFYALYGLLILLGYAVGVGK